MIFHRTLPSSKDDKHDSLLAHSLAHVIPTEGRNPNGVTITSVALGKQGKDSSGSAFGMTNAPLIRTWPFFPDSRYQFSHSVMPFHISDTLPHLVGNRIALNIVLIDAQIKQQSVKFTFIKSAA